MPGGVIGFYCHHQYAHSQESGRKSIPAGFKGVDLAIYSVFHILGLEVGVHPIVENEFQKMGGLSHRDLMKGPRAHGKGDYVYNRLDELKSQHLKYADEDNVSSDDDMDGKLDDENVGYYDNADEMSIRERDENTTIVGGKLHGPTFDENYDEMFIGVGASNSLTSITA